MEWTNWQSYSELDCERFNKQPGVWILRGKPKNDPEKYECLQVCQTKNLRNEIKKDIKYLNREEPICMEKEYRNFLGEWRFDYDDYLNTSEKCLYGNISDNYKDLQIAVITAAENIIEDIELYIAVTTKSVYWRHCGRQSTQLTREQLEKFFADKCDAIDKDLKRKVDKIMQELKLIK